MDKVKREKKVFIVSLVLLFIFIIFFSMEVLNFIKYNYISYDDAYNATVAFNMSRYGKYMVSYPDNIIFYNIITTGPLVLLPTSLLYYLFGVSNLTTGIVPLVYSIFDIVLIFLIFNKCFCKIKYGFIFSSLFTILLCLSDSLYIHISCHLIGESAALFFMLLAMLFLILFYEKNNNKYLFLVGGFIACSFLTKSSMIFIVISLFGLFYIEGLFKKISVKQLLYFIFGFGLFFCLIDLFKLIQLGSFSQYLKYWIDELGNMVVQSSGNESVSFIDKFNYLEEIFGINKYISLFIIMVPVVSYIYFFVRRYYAGDFKFNKHYGGLLFMGVAASSLLVYFLIFGSGGLMYARRHVVNSIILKIIMIIVSMMVIFSERIKKNKYKYILLVVVLLSIFPVGKVKNNFIDMYEKESEDTYRLVLMKDLVDMVSSLDKDAVIYVAGWWQEPNILLAFPNLKLIDIYGNNYIVDNKFEKKYFLVGGAIDNIRKSEVERVLNAKLIRINTNIVDYDKIIDEFDREDFDLYSLYKIERK